MNIPALNKIGLDNSSYFDTNNTKMGEIKNQLDSQSDKDKLEGMKRLIAMISKGRDVSSVFPDVVKNVVCKNLEVKKLVYMYLTHYAELEPESALLAINTFQKALSDQNQLIRASALRVMSSIRVLDIVQLIVLAVEKAVKDSSPYVRKAAAHAIPKVYRLDPEKKENLVGIISTLLGDTSTMVLGSAVAAFCEVCPDQLDLIHPHFRKLCRLLADVDEWGQVFVLNLLTRYARSQFACPDAAILATNGKRESPKKSKAFYDDDEVEEDAEEDKKETVTAEMDPDHRLLLKSALPLLQSRNNGVVMAVAALYYYIAPIMEAQRVGKSLVRILRISREVQYIVLTNIATMAASRPNMFEPQLAEFFVDATDPEFTRSLKLEVLTHVANASNIGKILREFKEYVKSEDKTFVTATIQAIGRCASTIPEVTESCMHGLMALMSNPAEVVVAESVIVIKKLLQLGANDPANDKRHRSIIRHLAKLLDTITSPMARASICWVVGEYCEKIPLIAPDVFRKLAKNFVEEKDIVKLQILNLGAKLHLTNEEQTSQIFQYILTLAKFDLNYDIRDRARMMRVLLLNKDGNANTLHGSAKTLFVNQKPAPSVISISEDRQRFMLGSLSHIVNHSTLGYQALPDFPEVPPDASVRNPPAQEASRWLTQDTSYTSSQAKEENFWGDEEEEGEYEEEEEEEGEEKEEGEEFYSDKEEEYSDEYDEEEGDYDDGDVLPPPAAKPAPAKKAPAPTPAPTPAPSNGPSKKTPAKPAPAKKPADSLPDLDDLFGFSSPPAPSPATSPASPPKPTPAATKSKTGAKQAAAPPKASSSLDLANDLANDLAGLEIGKGPTLSPTHVHKSIFSQTPVPAQGTPRKVLLKHVLGGGLEVEYSFLRRTSVHGPRVNTVQLYLTNKADYPLNYIRIGKTNLAPGMDIKPFNEIRELAPGTSSDQVIYITFNNITQPVKFELCHDRGTYNLTLAPVIGELVKPVSIGVDEFNESQRKLGGMNENMEPISVAEKNITEIAQLVLDTANVGLVAANTDKGSYKFAGETMLSDGGIVLLSIDVNAEGIGKCTVNCENGIFGSVLLKKIIEILVKE